MLIAKYNNTSVKEICPVCGCTHSPALHTIVFDGDKPLCDKCAEEKAPKLFKLLYTRSPKKVERIFRFGEFKVIAECDYSITSMTSDKMEGNFSFRIEIDGDKYTIESTKFPFTLKDLTII